MLDKIIQKAMGFLQQPVATFQKEKKTEVMEAFVYLAILSIVSAILSGIVALFLPGAGAFSLMVMVSAYIGGIVGAVILSLWLHLWVYIFGAKKGLNQTFKAVFYGNTPTYLFGWIPFLGLLFLLWALFLQWTGLKSLQDMPGDKAAFAIVVAIIIPFILIGLLTLVGLSMLASYGGLTGLPSMPFQV